MPRYVVAIRREHWAPGATLHRVLTVPGVDLQGDPNGRRATIEATPETAADLAQRFPELLVEPEILHGKP